MSDDLPPESAPPSTNPRPSPAPFPAAPPALDETWFARVLESMHDYLENQKAFQRRYEADQLQRCAQLRALEAQVGRTNSVVMAALWTRIPSPPPNGETRLKGKTLLIAEDEELLTVAMGAVLGREGCAVVPAHNAKEARTSVPLRKPDVALVDVRLGDDDGIELGAWLLEQGVGVVLMTGFRADDPLLDRARELGLTILEKPFPIEDAIRAVEDALIGVAK